MILKKYFLHLRKQLTLGLLLTGLISFNAYPLYAETMNFSDVMISDWYYNDVDYLYQLKSINGYSDGTFKPHQTVSKAEFLKMILSALDAQYIDNAVKTVAPTDSIYNAFKTEYDWRTDYVITAANYHLCDTDYPNCTILDTPLSRAEMCSILIKISNNMLNMNLTASPDIASRIADYNALPALYLSEIEIAYSNGLMTGVNDAGTFSPYTTCTRAEAATIIARVLKMQNISSKPAAPDSEPVVNTDSISSDSTNTNISDTNTDASDSASTDTDYTEQEFIPSDPNEVVPIVPDPFLNIDRSSYSSYKLGIDVSYVQGIIDWDKVKASGVEFAMIRAGYGNTSLQEDTYFKRNIEGAQKAGIACGAYWFSYARSTDEAKKEAQAFMQVIAPYELTYPVAFDFETDSVNYASKYDVTVNKKLATDIVRTFCNELRENGYYVVNYSNVSFLNSYFDTVSLSDIDLWLAKWSSEMPDLGQTLWQYDSAGQIEGIVGSVDLNISFIDYESLLSH